MNLASPNSFSFGKMQTSLLLLLLIHEFLAVNNNDALEVLANFLTSEVEYASVLFDNVIRNPLLWDNISLNSIANYFRHNSITEASFILMH